MTDIIERLRVNMHAYGIAQEAANEIERLRGQYAAMEASLDEYRTLDCEIKEENYRLREVIKTAYKMTGEDVIDLALLREMLYRHGGKEGS